MLGGLDDFHKALGDWVTSQGRVMPWRAPWGATQDPYRTWISEVMLQQTQVVTVIPYYERFIARWPGVEALAAAPLEAVLREWAGLGYYSRARALHACAQVVAGELAGRFPSEEAALRALPGIGPYTAAAIRAIAFQLPASVVDGNVERVVTRLFAEPKPLSENRKRLAELASGLLPSPQSLAPGTHAQGMMELGATLCRPKTPSCAVCPVQAHCRAAAEGLALALPTPKPKPVKPVRHGQVYWIEDGGGRVALEQRPAHGLLGGMHGFPGSEWLAGPLPKGKPSVRHVFTHFALELDLEVRMKGALPEGCFWHPVAELEALALPSLMQKVAAQALKTRPASGRGRVRAG